MNARRARGKTDRMVGPASEMFLFASFFFAIVSGLLASAPQDVRILQVKAVIDQDYRGGPLKEVEFARWLRSASLVFQKSFGLRFNLKRYAYWRPPADPLPLPRLMREFLNDVGPEEADIVIGLVSPDRTDSRSAGVASYADGTLLLKGLNSERSMTLVLVHELCHLFGAVDLNSGGSVMSTREIRLDFDPFTSRVVAIHRSRAFGAAARPLPDKDFREALTAYQERAAMALGEVELDLLLARLYLDFDERTVPSSEAQDGGRPCPAVDCVGEAVRRCEIALAGRPGWAAAQHLLGLALERGGNLERARACFKKAAALETDSGIRR